VEVAIFTTLLEIVLKTFKEDKFNRRGFTANSTGTAPSMLIFRIAGLPF